MSRTLRYCRYPSLDRLLSSNLGAEKIFPVLTAEDEDYLKKLASLYGANSQAIEGPQAPSEFYCATPKRGAVLCLDTSLLPAAKLYAGLTDRELSCGAGGIISLNETVDRDQVDILILRYSDWTNDLTQLICPYTYEPDRPLVGLILALDPLDAFRQAVRRAAALYLSENAPEASHVSRVGILATFPVEGLSTERMILLGRNAAPDLVEEVLGCNADVLAIATHSDGVDSPLPAGKVFCGLKGRSRAFSGAQPVCVASRTCHRSGYRPLEEALGSNELVAASALCAKVIFYRACSVLYPVRDGFDPGDSLGQSVLHQSVFGCLLTTTDVIVANPLVLHEELDVISTSENVAAALYRLAERNAKNATRPRYFCFGDPRHLISQVSDSAPPQKEIPEYPTRAPAPALDQGSLPSFASSILTIEALRDCSLKSFTSSDDRRQAETVWHAALVRCRHNLRTDGQGRPSIEDLLSICLPFIRSELSDAWMQLGASWKEVPSTHCLHCGSKARGLICSFRSFHLTRTVVSCACCGIAQDRPQNFDVGVRISATAKLTLRDVPRPANTRFFIRVHTHQKEGPSVTEVHEEAIRAGYCVRSAYDRATPAQVAVFGVKGAEIAVDSRNVLLLPLAST